MIPLAIWRDFETRWRAALEGAGDGRGPGVSSFSDCGEEGLVISVRLPPPGSSRSKEAARWLSAFASLLRELLEEAEASGSKRRPVTLTAGEEVHAGARAVRLHPGPPWRIECEGPIGYLLETLGAPLDGFRSEPAFPVGSRRFTLEGARASEHSAYLLARAASWWAEARSSDVFFLMEEVRRRVGAQVSRIADAHPWRARLYREALVSHLLELELEGIWNLAPLFGDQSLGELEVEGWTREFEAALRSERPDLFSGFNGLGLPTAPGGRPRSEKPEAARPLPTLDLGGFDEPGNSQRTRPEVVQRLCLRWGLSWSDAAKAAEAIAARRPLLAERAASTDQSVLYFAYGSCMCRPSLRETVPRFELIGAARLKGYRLAFTYKSVARGGGVADVVPDPGREVWGVLFRVPQKYLVRLDEREGAHLGLYERAWVAVEFQGSLFEPVLTYTVVNKELRELAPTPEYAGLIYDGARAFVPPHYSAWLLEKFSEFDVEPELPA